MKIQTDTRAAEIVLRLSPGEALALLSAVPREDRTHVEAAVRELREVERRGARPDLDDGRDDVICDLPARKEHR